MVSGQNKTYTVRKGENDETIAKKANLTVHQLHVLNPNRNWLHLMPGTKLVLQKSSEATKTAGVPSFVKTAVFVKHLIDKNDLGDISIVAYSGEPKSPTQAQSQQKTPFASTAPKIASYKVRQGDNDWVIAARVGTTPRQVRLLNPGINWDRLATGTTLQVPRNGTVVAHASQTAGIRSRYAKIARDSVIIRRGPGVAADKVTVVDAGLAVTVLDKTSGWYKLKFPRGTVGWVRGDMLKAAARPVVATRTRRTQRSTYVASNSRSRRHRSTEIFAQNPDKGNRLLTKAFSMKGTPYRYGQSSRSGVDCSGFSSLVYRDQGVKLPRTSRDQSHVGSKISKGQLQKGDLVFFKTNRGSRINHVGIYIGNGKFIHASSGGGKVQVNSLNEGYYNRRYATARRVVKKSNAHKKK
jgi:cell wall-associated NlpC family hydrolase